MAIRNLLNQYVHGRYHECDSGGQVVSTLMHHVIDRSTPGGSIILQIMNGSLINGRYRKTTPLEKLLTSLVNVVVVFVVSIPFLILEDISAFTLKLIIIGLFFLENIMSMIFFEYRLPGMLVQRSIWQCKYTKLNQMIHAIMYTASFATMLFWVWVPGDLLLFNILLLQLPCVLLTKTTFHGLIAGNMVDVKQSS